MMSWIGLLAGSVVFGAMVVAALVFPRGASAAALVAAFVGMLASVTSFGAIASRYNTPEAIAGSMVVLIAAITAGYAVASTSLPYLRLRSRPPVFRQSMGDREGVILLCCCDPERYDPRVIAGRQSILAESAEIVVPVTALPFVFFAEKTRYRAIGGRAQGPAVARQLADRVTDSPESREWLVRLAWCHTPRSLPAAVAALASEGARRVALVPLGLPESGMLNELQKSLAPLAHEPGVPALASGPTIWNDRLLPERMAERIIAATAGADPGGVGVVLVGEGAPEKWERRFTAAAAAETFFNQRVRVLLADAGIDERHVRVCWLEWQTPDVTESVRHLAALGCTRIVVAPATIPLPTLETSLDLGHNIALARVPEDVLVVTLVPWGDDEGIAEAVRRSAKAALDDLKGNAAATP